MSNPRSPKKHQLLQFIRKPESLSMWSLKANISPIPETFSMSLHFRQPKLLSPKALQNPLECSNLEQNFKVLWLAQVRAAKSK